MMNIDFDSVIFDMDGTLWDAVDTYAHIWNITSDRFGITRRVTRDDLLQQMGQPIDRIVNAIFHDSLTGRRNDYLNALLENESALTKTLGGRLYDGVADGIKQLSRRYKLLMASNCGADGLHNFLKYTGLTEYFTDTITNGETHLDKAENIKILIERHNLTNPVYVGDTQHDCTSAHKAGIPMIFVTYGFGQCTGYDAKADNFNQLVKLLSEKI